jgi:heme/copper-type cytochrome/quinol oxidase subunit 2
MNSSKEGIVLTNPTAIMVSQIVFFIVFYIAVQYLRHSDDQDTNAVPTLFFIIKIVQYIFILFGSLFISSTVGNITEFILE